MRNLDFRLGRSGSAAVEFGLVVTPFMLMLAGALEVGVAAWTQNTLQLACETASHYVYANSTNSVATLQAAIPAQVQAGLVGLDPSKVQVSTSAGALDGVSLITISATYPVSFSSLLGLPVTTVNATVTVPVD